jgi:YfiH family protein
VTTSAPPPAPVLEAETVESFAELGVTAFTTGRSAGSFGTHSDEPVRDVLARWSALRSRLGGARLATAAQVHGDTVLEHRAEWEGWLRGDAADGHLALARGTAMAVSVADCVPVFIAHASGATAILHSGWRGTAARIAERAIRRFQARGIAPSGLRVHCGPAICGRCYEVSGDVARQLTGRDPGRAVTVDLRELIVGHVRALGVRHVSSSTYCTRCDNDRFFSHRAGDTGRQLGVILART